MEFSSNDLKMLFDDIENLSKGDLLGIPFIIGNTSLKNDCFVEDDNDTMHVTLKPNQFDSDSYIQLRTYVNQCLNRTNTQNKCLICNNNWCSDEIIKCANNNCENAVHESCYGLIPRDNQNRWYCWNCVNKTPITCAICLEKGGILKPTNTGQYCHVICATFTPETSLADNPMLEPVLGIKNISKERYTLQCSLCNRHKGACIQCCYGKCTVSFHPLCALKSELLMISDNGIPFVAYCNKHLKLIQKSKIKYCICNKESIENDFYIECTYGKGGCKGWVHPECIGMTREQAEQLENYICPLCKPLYEKEENEREKTKTKSRDGNENNNSNNKSSRRNLRKRNRMRYNYDDDDNDDLDNSSDEEMNNNPFPLSSEFCDNSWEIIGKDKLTLHLRLTNELIGLKYVNENSKKREKEYEDEIESESDNEEEMKDKGEEGDDDYNTSESNDESDSDHGRKKKKRGKSKEYDDDDDGESNEESEEMGSSEESDNDENNEDKYDDEKEEERKEKKKVKEEKIIKKNIKANNNKSSRSRNKDNKTNENENDEYESLFYYTSTWKIIKQDGLNIRLKLTGSVLDKNNRNNENNNNRERKKNDVVDENNNNMEEIIDDDVIDDEVSENSGVNEELEEEGEEEEEEEKPKKKSVKKSVIKKKTPVKKRVVNRKPPIKKKKKDYYKYDDDWSDSD